MSIIFRALILNRLRQACPTFIGKGPQLLLGSGPLASHVNIAVIGILLLLLTAIGLSPGGSSYFTCIQNMKLVNNKFKSGGLHEKRVVATWNLGNHLSICF